MSIRSMFSRNFHFELHLQPKTYAACPVVSSAIPTPSLGPQFDFCTVMKKAWRAQPGLCCGQLCALS